MRIAWALMAIVLAGCMKQPPSPEVLAKLKGGTTKVVVYGFCIPMDHLIKTTMTRYTMTFVVDGKPYGTMQSCSYATFQVPSGYWTVEFVPTGFRYTKRYPGQIFRPGETQYLSMNPAGNRTFSADWVSKERAEKEIAQIKGIGQIF